MPGWDPVAECGWKLNTPDPEDGEISLSYAKINSTVFRWRYTSPEEDHVKSLMGFMKRQGKMEHMKITLTTWTEADKGEVWTW